MPIFLNNKLVESFNFPGGECQVKVNSKDIGIYSKIKAYLYNSDDIMRLLLTVYAVRDIESESYIYLTIPYFPYARQDRICNEGEALSVKVMTNLINSLECSKVTIYDPHSDVAPALLNNCEVISAAEIIAKSPLAHFICENNLTLLSPDAGAEKKVLQVAKQLQLTEVIHATKARDTATGKITSCRVYGDVGGMNLIILDDICDGGQTFVELAKHLKAQGAKAIYLYITHGIFSKGLSVLKQHFEHVYCYHTMLKAAEIDRDFLTILEDK